MKSSDRSHSWLKPGLETRNTGTGQGVFATRCFGKDELLAIFGGHVMPIHEEPVFSDKHSDLALQIHDDFVLGPKLYDEIEEADFFNHSCDPNAGFRGQMFLVAMRNIVAGEQVCFDYGMAVSASIIWTVFAARQTAVELSLETIGCCPSCKRVTRDIFSGICRRRSTSCTNDEASSGFATNRVFRAILQQSAYDAQPRVSIRRPTGCRS